MLALFGLVAIVGFFTYLAWRDRADLEAKAILLGQEQALVLADHATRVLEASELALSIVIDELNRSQWDEVQRSRPLWERAHRMAERLPYIEAFWLYDERGGLRLSSLAFPPPSIDAANHDFFVSERDAPSPVLHIANPLAASAARPTIRLSRRLEWPDGSFRGVASMTLESAYFLDFYRTVTAEHGTTVTLLRGRDLSTLVQQPQAGPQASANPTRLGQALVIAPEGGTFRAQSPEDGSQRIHAYRRVAGFPLYVEVSIPLAEIQAAWVRRIRERATTGGGAVVALGLLSMLALHQARRERAFQRQLAEKVEERTAALAQANAKLETLFHEIHHRVKNNLQIIGSLLTLQSARLADPGGRAALAQATGRVHTMSLVHQQLYGTGELTDLAFSDYLRRLVHQLADIYGATDIGLKVEGENPRLPLETAIPVALIVNEVLSEMLSHPFPDGGGEVAITLAAADDGWVLAIAASGLADDPVAASGDGLSEEIVRSLAAQLGGAATSRGTRFTLRFPKGPDDPADST